MAYKKKVHKVKKGETLTDIAKKYKLKSWKDIWQAPENKKLVAKRKKAEQIQPGDVFTIPFNPAQWDKITQEIAEWQGMLAADTKLLASFEKRRAQSENAIKKLQRTAALSDKMHKAIVAELQKTAAGAKRWGTTVDAIATVSQLMVGLGKMVKTGYKAASVTGKELIEINEKLAKDAVVMIQAPIKTEARKAVAKHVQNEKKGYSLALVSLGILSDSFDKMTSPSFWAWTVARLKEGDSWSDAVTYDFQKEVKQKIAQITRDHKQSLGEIRKAIAAQKKLIGEISKERNNTIGRIADAKKALKELEKLH